MKYQLHCPKCHHEFAYDNGYYDRNIHRLGMEIQQITKQLTDFKLLPLEERKRKERWRQQMRSILQEKSSEISELKAIRKGADQQVLRAKYEIFKDIVLDRYGEQAVLEMLKEADKELEAYKVSGLMVHEYTRSNAKSNVTSINKIR